MKSRVNREVHARFCEGLGVKCPGATRSRRTMDYGLQALNACIGDYALIWLRPDRLSLLRQLAEKLVHRVQHFCLVGAEDVVIRVRHTDDLG
jgi:hypothetical protein